MVCAQASAAEDMIESRMVFLLSLETAGGILESTMPSQEWCQKPVFGA